MLEHTKLVEIQIRFHELGFVLREGRSVGTINYGLVQ